MKGPAAAGGGIAVLVIAVVVMLMGGDPSALLESLPQQGAGQGQSGQAAPQSAEDNELAKFVSVVLADTEDVWNAQFQKIGERYEEPKLVLFTGAVTSACGRAGAAVGPFYCPADKQIYIDLSFYNQLKRDLGAPGDFAQAYVIAHEVGHHVQNLLGFNDRLNRARRSGASQTEINRLSVRLELQADFLSGVWAHHAQKLHNILEEGDIEEALNAAEKIGDDALQRKSGGAVRPDSFTHGSSAQRARWFRHGLRTGDITQGDTFDETNFRRVETGG